MPPAAAPPRLSRNPSGWRTAAPPRPHPLLSRTAIPQSLLPLAMPRKELSIKFTSPSFFVEFYCRLGLGVWSSGERTVKKLRLSKALTIPEETTVSDACRRMAARKVDSVLLTDADGLLSGIVTDKVKLQLRLLLLWRP